MFRRHNIDAKMLHPLDITHPPSDTRDVAQSFLLKIFIFKFFFGNLVVRFALWLVVFMFVDLGFLFRSWVVYVIMFVVFYEFSL